MSVAMVTRAELRDRILALPDLQRERALALARVVYTLDVVEAPKEGLKRDVEQRRSYAMDPIGYAEEIFGYDLTEQQKRVARAAVKYNRLLVPAAQSVGKSFLLGLLSMWRLDCWGSRLNERGGEIGARILLPGPSEQTVKETIYSNILEHAKRAEERGFAMPGTRSELSVLWRVPGHPQWGMECLSPPSRVGQRQAHMAAGRHHKHLFIFIEEGAGVLEAVWQSCEGMASGLHNAIVSAYNPTEPSGPAVARESEGIYHVERLSALEFPNVVQREEVVPGAVSHTRIDALVRIDCVAIGPHPGTALDPKLSDFVYALPPSPDAPEKGGRKDGVSGHPDGRPMVYRPGDTAKVSILGHTASANPGGVFSSEAIDRSFERYRNTPQPARPPDRIGVDPAREGDCEALAFPTWGPAAEDLLRLFIDAMGNEEKMAALRSKVERIRIGQGVVLQRGDGPTMARELHQRWPGIPFSMDDGGQGVSCNDSLARIYRESVTMVTFGGEAPPPLAGLPWCTNMRAWLYLIYAQLFDWDLVDVAPDEMLRAELLAQQMQSVTRSVIEGGVRRTVSARQLIPKEYIAAMIGRSPDRGDGSAIAASGLAAKPRARVTITTLKAKVF